jgi:D-hydroxyproline dehydrogenase subunit alpha
MTFPADGKRRDAAKTGFFFDGRPENGIEGESIAAALTAAGHKALGTRADGTARGLHCGMGVCQECLVTVDGGSHVRACATALEPGMRVARFADGGEAAAAGPISEQSIPIRRPDILVVGGGPAGLAAARAAVLCGAEVSLIDERPELGGQYFKQPAKNHGPTADAQARKGRDLIAEVERQGVRVLREAALWGAFGPAELAVLAGGAQQVFAPSRLILATGAYERGVPVPGWTLPGYMTTGAAQTLLRAYGVAPGRRVLVAGNGPLNLQVAAELVAAGVTVAAVAEAAPRPGARHVPALAKAIASSPDLVRDGFGYLRRLIMAGVPIHYRHAVIAATGGDAVKSAVIARIDPSGLPMPGTQKEFAVDAVCVNYGFLPANEIARAIGCRHHYDAQASCLVPDRDGDGQSTKAGVYIAGDAAGMGGAHAALAQGFIAGCAAARSLGKAVPPAVEAELQASRARLRRHRSFQAALWRLFAAPRLTTQLAGAETVICRCEGVSLGQVRQAMDGGGASSLGAVKRQTRAGMGRCQGRYCGPLIAEMLSARDETSFAAPRPPIKPVPIAAIARKPAS